MSTKAGIFLSHSRADKPFVRRLQTALESHGAKTWLDERELVVGDDLFQQIGKAIDEMEYLGAVLSKNSVNSHWVNVELRQGMHAETTNGRVKVVPIRLDDCEIPGFLKGKFYADFRDEEKFAQGIVDILRRLGINVKKSHDKGVDSKANERLPSYPNTSRHDDLTLVDELYLYTADPNDASAPWSLLSNGASAIAISELVLTKHLTWSKSVEGLTLWVNQVRPAAPDDAYLAKMFNWIADRIRFTGRPSIGVKGLLPNSGWGYLRDGYPHKKGLTTKRSIWTSNFKFTGHRDQRRVRELFLSEFTSGQFSIGSAIVLAVAHKCLTSEHPRKDELIAANAIFRDMEEVKNATELLDGTEIPPNPLLEPDWSGAGD